MRNKIVLFQVSQLWSFCFNWGNLALNKVRLIFLTRKWPSTEPVELKSSDFGSISCARWYHLSRRPSHLVFHDLYLPHLHGCTNSLCWLGAASSDWILQAQWDLVIWHHLIWDFLKLDPKGTCYGLREVQTKWITLSRGLRMVLGT